MVFLVDVGSEKKSSHRDFGGLPRVWRSLLASLDFGRNGHSRSEAGNKSESDGKNAAKASGKSRKTEELDAEDSRSRVDDAQGLLIREAAIQLLSRQENSVR